MSCIENLREKLEKMAFITGAGGAPTQWFCKLHKFRLTTGELKRKQCLQKNCTHLTAWKYAKNRYRK